MLNETVTSATGLTVYLRFDDATCRALEAWTRTLPVTRIVPADKIHLTMFRNAEVFEHFASLGDFDKPLDLELTDMKLHVFQIASGGNALTVNFASKRLMRRANEIRRLFRATKKRFHPHISLAYGAGNLGKRQLRQFEAQFPLRKVTALGEYVSPVLADWARAIV